MFFTLMLRFCDTQASGIHNHNRKSAMNKKPQAIAQIRSRFGGRLEANRKELRHLNFHPFFNFIDSFKFPIKMPFAKFYALFIKCTVGKLYLF